MTVLIAKQLAKSYKGMQVVKNVTLHVNTGETVGLLGSNGAGKSTSFYMIVGLERADKGKILLDNTDISHYPIHKRARLGIGYLPQEPSIFRKLTVEQNILAVLQNRPALHPLEYDDKVNSLLRHLNITGIRRSLGLSLSGGERRRVEIARALALEPQFILLDEPFAGVDPLAIDDIKSIILQLQQHNIGILITDHNVRETLDICNRAYIMNDGNVIAEGTPDALLQNEQVRNVYLGDNFRI